MEINGFWIDETVEEMIEDMQARNCEKAGDFQKALRILYPRYRQITCAQDFSDFVQAVTDYRDNQEALAHYGSNY